MSSVQERYAHVSATDSGRHVFGAILEGPVGISAQGLGFEVHVLSKVHVIIWIRKSDF